MISDSAAVFDFSLDAAEFRDKLAGMLKKAAAAGAVPLDDDDLEQLNAAGDPYRIPEDGKKPE